MSKKPSSSSFPSPSTLSSSSSISTTTTTVQLSEDAKQEQLLSEAKQMINVQSFQMKRALDANNFSEALKNASNIISELRTNSLTPKTYYALYIFTVDQLRHLEFYISEGPHGRSLHSLYELIQCAGNILPRLYLMIIVGSVFIKKMGAPAKDILNDLVELCRGVQHPTRGLFLRTFLSEMTKDKLPDEGTKFEGDVNDSINFILINFTEMNKLWVRMQHGMMNLSKREQEREELNVLVGKNLSRLSQLDGLTKDIYKETVLPRILAQVVQCKDRIAQQYLLVILIQVFSDEFHLHTLTEVLEVCSKLESDVKVHIIVNSLIERVTNHCVNQPHVASSMNLFQLFENHLDEIVKSNPSLPFQSFLEMQNSVMLFSLKCYKDNLDNIDTIFASIRDEAHKLPDPTSDLFSVLQTPITFFKSVRPVLKLKNYSPVFSMLPLKEKRQMALFFIDWITQNSNSRLCSLDEVLSTFDFLSTIVKTPDEQLSSDDWASDQYKLSCFITTLYTNDVEIMYNILLKTKEYFTESKVDVLYTMVPLIYKGLQLIQNLQKQKGDTLWEKKAQKVCSTVRELVHMVKSPTNIYLTFQLFLQCALQAGKCSIGKFAYAFLSRALEIYEDEGILQSNENYEALTQLTGVVQSLSCFDLETSEKLSKRIATHSIKINVEKHQIRAIAVSAHLFLLNVDNGSSTYRDPKSAVSCLRKAFSVLQGLEEVTLKATLLVELLDHFIYFFDKHPDVVEANTVNLFAAKVIEHFYDSKISSLHPCSIYLKSISQIVENRKRWDFWIKKKDSSSSQLNSNDNSIEIKEDYGLTDVDAKKNASKWNEINLNYNALNSS